MAPGRPRRVQAAPSQSQNIQNDNQDQQEFPAFFIDPMMGTPLPIYVDKDVEDRENIVRLITVSIALSLCMRAPAIRNLAVSNTADIEPWTTVSPLMH